MIDKQVWHPVQPESVSTRPIPCRLFLKEKMKNEIKVWKGRLVAGAHKQIREQNTNTYSPTAHLQTIFAFALNAAKQNHTVVTLDITGAYLNAQMPSDVYMLINTDLTNHLLSIDKSYESYLNDRNQLIVKLDRALYECIESARLWYLDISTFRLSIGFI